MNTSTTPKVFISYNHKDQAVAHKIKGRLELIGIEVIIDSVALDYGQNIEEFIKECIKQSGITLSIVSSHSLKSAWVAMESIWSCYDVDIRGRYFLPCYIDTSFLDNSFVTIAHKVVEEEIKKIDELIIYRRENKIGIEDIQDELTRLNRLNSELPSIIGRLKKLLCGNLCPENFDSGMEKVIKVILNKKPVSIENKQIETPELDKPPSSETLGYLPDPEVPVNRNDILGMRKGEKSPTVFQIVQLLENNQIPEALEQADQILFAGSDKFLYFRKKEAYSAGLKGQDLLDWIREIKVFLSKY
jgi:hypothetical protein